MALISCTECGKQVSDKAATCPGCGNPLSSQMTISVPQEQVVTAKRAGTKWEAAGFVLILIGMILAAMANIDDTNIMPGVLVGLSGLVVFIIGRFK